MNSRILPAVRRLITAHQGRACLFACLSGAMAGIGFYTLIYAEGFSYLGSAPETCVNCHIMQSQYDSWQKSSHHHTARCVDCHLPHTFTGKYVAKAENGYHHSKAFTLQNFHEPIMIKKKNSRILIRNCIACHTDVADSMYANAVSAGLPADCIQCHKTTGHGETAGLGRIYLKTELNKEM